MATKSVLSDQQRRARDLEIGKGHAITNAWAHYEGWVLAYELATCGEKLSAARIAFICDALGVNPPEAGDESEMARDYISDSALSVEVRSGWQLANNGQGELTQAEFRICFATGGPSLYLQGWIDHHDQPRGPETVSYTHLRAHET